MGGSAVLELFENISFCESPGQSRWCGVSRGYSLSEPPGQTRWFVFLAVIPSARVSSQPILPLTDGYVSSVPLLRAVVPQSA